MKTSLPGYTAEVSLGPSGERHEARHDANRGRGTQAVQPQFCRRQGNSIVCIECSDGYCWTNVIHVPMLF